MRKLFLLLLLIPIVSAGIEPVVFTLDETNPVYTVPAGKVLVLEAFGADMGYGDMHVNLIKGGITNKCRFSVHGNGITGAITTLDRPIKIAEQTVITPLVIAGDISYVFFGLLANQSDLYVYIDNDPSKMLVQDGTFSFDVHTSTPRPVRIGVEGSVDLLTTWQPAHAKVEKKAPDTYTVSIPVADEVNYFAKYRVRETER